MEKIEKIVSALENCDFNMALESFVIEQNDDITNGVREKLDGMPQVKIQKIRDFLSNLLNLCYDGKLLDGEEKETVSMLSSLKEHDLFLFKETVIYFLGRLSLEPDIEILKKAYFADENKYIRLNLVFASLCTFDETIEMDFVNRCSVGSDYDEMIRSWTMAYFNMIDDPYHYVDTKDSDWTKARLPRIKRLRINNPEDLKYKKAMSFRLLDLLVLHLFLENRNESLSEDDKEVVENTFIEYEKYSSEKQQLMRTLKKDILNK